MVLLLNGDCLEEMKSLEDNSIDLIFCDLPYGVLKCKWDCPIDLELFWKEVMRIKKLNCPVFMTTTTKFGISLINSCPKKCPFRYDLCWEKSQPAGFLSSHIQPLRSHEMIYVFYEKKPFYDLSSHKHKFKNSDNGENTINTIYGDDVKVPNYVNKRNKKTGYSAYDPPLPRSVLSIKSTKRKHQTEKPVELIEWILKYFSREGDLILDPTMGSGSCGKACENMGRDFIGIELDKEIYDKACDRIKIK